MLSLALVNTRNAPIPIMKIRQIEYLTVFFKSILLKIRCSLNPKAQAVNKFQRQLRPEQYFPEFFKSRAQSTIKCNSSLIQDLDQASISTIQEFPVSRKSF